MNGGWEEATLTLRLGDILVARGILTAAQKEQALAAQENRAEPFGSICERLFGIDPDAIEEAWATQYARLTRTIDPRVEVFEPRATELISRRQAWQFRVLPIRFDDRELMMATTARHLRRALRFATQFIPVPVYLVIADADVFGQALCERYPLAGMTPQSVNDDAMDRLLELAKGM